MSSERNDPDDMDTSISTIDTEGKINYLELIINRVSTYNYRYKY